MPGRATAVNNGSDLVKVVVGLVKSLGLEAKEQVEVGRRLWGARRKIDVVAIDRRTRNSLGIECKYQGTQGTAEEKLPSTILDIEAWPIKGIVVFDGPGFTANMKAYLLSTGKGVELPSLEAWLKLFFGLFDD